MKSRPGPLAMARKYPPDCHRTATLRCPPGTPRIVTPRTDSTGWANWRAAPVPRVRHCRKIASPAAVKSRNSFPPSTSFSTPWCLSGGGSRAERREEAEQRQNHNRVLHLH